MSKVTKTIDDFTLARLPAPYDGQSVPDVSDLRFIKAAVPRSIHYDLMDANMIDNVYGGRQNVLDAGWVSQADWVYVSQFSLTEDELKSDIVELRFECIDTFANVYVNDTLIGSSDNAFTPWTFDVPKIIRRPTNRLLAHIKGHGRMVADKADENVRLIGCKGNDEWSRERTLIRRYQRSYNSDFFGGGVNIQGIGLTRPVHIVSYNTQVIVSTTFATLDANSQRANIRLIVTTKGATHLDIIIATLSLSGKTYGTYKLDIKDDMADIRAELINPVFWWPCGSGEQVLYDLNVELISEGKLADRSTRRVGIRKSELILRKPSGRQTFQFVINGVPTYMRGANWVPIDMLNAVGTRDETYNLLTMCQNANINMLRLWGGGVEEPEWFYDRCDELGIMIWQDAKMHSHTYPDYDPEFVKRVADESAQMVTRLRSHACFAIFCGGNEQEEGWDHWNWPSWHERFFGERIIYEALPNIAMAYCPEIPYIPNSPFGEKHCQSPVDFDTHTWGNFYNATEDPCFVTETCWYDGTISRPETLAECYKIDPKDFAGLKWSQEFTKLTGHDLHQRNEYTEYHDALSLTDYCRTIEIEQMRADYTALYYLRTRSPSCCGILYWPLNKGGPMMNYGAIDYHGRPLMPYYNMARLFNGRVMHAYRDINDINVVAANDYDDIQVTITVELRTVDGKVISSQRIEQVLPHGNQIDILRVHNLYERVTNRWREFVYVKMEDDKGKILHEDAVYFCPFEEVEMESPELEAKAMLQDDGRYILTITSKSFSKLIMIESDRKVLFSDDYFLLSPNSPKQVIITPMENERPTTLRIEALDRAAERLTLSL